jgi:long-subunit fatty acid transport protein
MVLPPKLHPAFSLWAATVWLSLGLARAALATDGLEPIGLSVQSLLRGGADVAIGDSALSQIDNPATLRLVPGSIDASGEVLMPVTRWRGVYDTSGSSVHALPLGHIGVALPGNDRFNFGLAAWSKSQIGTSFHLRSLAAFTEPRRTYANMRDIGFGFNGAVRVTDDLSLGAGLRCELVTGEFTSLAGPEQVYFGRGYGLGAGFQLGLHYRITPDLTFGAGYRSPTWFQDLFGEHTSSGLTNDWEIRSTGARAVNFGRPRSTTSRCPRKSPPAGLAGHGSPAPQRRGPLDQLRKQQHV